MPANKKRKYPVKRNSIADIELAHTAARLSGGEGTHACDTRLGRCAESPPTVRHRSRSSSHTLLPPRKFALQAHAGAL
ncbi:hypothetical protein MRX96_034551 [Rhipicephalus microplus]